MRHDWRYAIWMLLGLVVSAMLLRRYQARLQLSSYEKFGLWVGAFCGGILGAKIPFVLADEVGLWDGTAWLADGKTILAGIVGAYFGVEVAKWACEIRVKTGDTFAVPAAIAVACGRLACFVGGCCFGTATNLPWGVCFPTAPEPNVPRHPTQLYEFGFHGGLAVLLFWFERQGWFRGQLIKLYILAYLAYRFVTEWIRPEARLFGELTGYQWAALVLIPLFAWLWWRDARQQYSASTAKADAPSPSQPASPPTSAVEPPA